MPHVGYSPQQNQWTQENKRLGSVMLTLGWIIIAMTALVGCFVFQDVREGSLFWIWWSAVQGAIGFGLIVVGTLYRRKIQV